MLAHQGLSRPRISTIVVDRRRWRFWKAMIDAFLGGLKLEKLKAKASDFGGSAAILWERPF